MLVLGRRCHESIIINDSIKITVLEIINKNHIRLGFEAPSDVSVHREESVPGR